MAWKKSVSVAGRTMIRPRHLAVERLEDRALLSVTVGMPVAVSSATTLQSLAAFTSAASTTTTATQLEMVLPRQVTRGVPVQVELLALDSLGNQVTTYSTSVALTSTDPNISLPQTISFSQGVSFFPVTFNTAGLQSLAAPTIRPFRSMLLLRPRSLCRRWPRTLPSKCRRKPRTARR